MGRFRDKGVGENGECVYRRATIDISVIGKSAGVLVLHLTVDVHSEESRLANDHNDLSIYNLTAVACGLRSHNGLGHRVPVQLGYLHLHTELLLHLEVDVRVGPTSQVFVVARGVAELLRGALSEEKEGVQPGVICLLPHLDTVVGRGGQARDRVVHTQGIVCSHIALTRFRKNEERGEAKTTITSAVSSKKNTGRHRVISEVSTNVQSQLSYRYYKKTVLHCEDSKVKYFQNGM